MICWLWLIIYVRKCIDIRFSAWKTITITGSRPEMQSFVFGISEGCLRLTVYIGVSGTPMDQIFPKLWWSKDMVREGFRCKPCCSGWMFLKILWRICTSSSMTLVIGYKKNQKKNVAQGPDVWCLKLVVESSRPVQVTLSSQVAQPSWKVSHAKNPWKTLMKYVFFLYKRGAGMVRVFLFSLYIYSTYIYMLYDMAIVSLTTF